MIYLLVENRDRELWSRLLIALAIHKQGGRCIVGSQRVIWANMHELLMGAMVFKGANAAMFPKAVDAIRADHTVAVIDEEGLNVADAAHMRNEVAPGFPSSVSFCASEAAARVYPASVIVGNPRLDLLTRPEIFAAPPRTGYTLVNTNTAGINHKGGAQAYHAMCESIGCFPTREQFMAHMAHEDARVRAIRAFLDAHEWPIVLRPHPGENADRWRDYCAGMPNVEVVTEGNHISWLKGADCVVHTGCTTAIEAAHLGVPSVSLLTGLPEDKIFVTNQAPYAATHDPVGAVDRATAPTVTSDGKAHERIASRLMDAGMWTAWPDIRLDRPEVSMDPYFAEKVQTSIDDVIGFYQAWGVEVPVVQIGDSVFQVG